MPAALLFLRQLFAQLALQRRRAGTVQAVAASVTGHLVRPTAEDEPVARRPARRQVRRASPLPLMTVQYWWTLFGRLLAPNVRKKRETSRGQAAGHSSKRSFSYP